MRLTLMQSETKKGLKQVYKILKDPDHWTQRVGAQRVDGSRCDANDPNAVRFCLIGAMSVVAGYRSPLFFDMGNSLRAQCGYGSIADFNDTHTYDEVMTILKKAIKAA